MLTGLHPILALLAAVLAAGVGVTAVRRLRRPTRPPLPIADLLPPGRHKPDAGIPQPHPGRRNGPAVHRFAPSGPAHPPPVGRVTAAVQAADWWQRLPADPDTPTPLHDAALAVGEATPIADSLRWPVINPALLLDTRAVDEAIGRLQQISADQTAEVRAACARLRDVQEGPR